ncbi:hypothetical protein BpHYR1_011032 [Brachionus plicatilis]|uniref:Uncharacterized protein n=1 Tax=Brachionus plicatilis TaxID=10195 RepID=A0A3M7PPM0_BRAPC|nr:hypothetical protein BpHYR1_011032 [Brachionus plicatilis]
MSFWYFLKQLTSSYLATHWSILDLWHYRNHWHYWHHWHHWSYSHWLTALISSAAHLLTDNLIFLNPKTIFSLKNRGSSVDISLRNLRMSSQLLNQFISSFNNQSDNGPHKKSICNHFPNRSTLDSIFIKMITNKTMVT